MKLQNVISLTVMAEAKIAKKSLVLILKADGTREFVSCSDLLSELGHTRGVITTDGYYILVGSAFAIRYRWFYGKFISDPRTKSLITGSHESSVEVYPSSLLIRKEEDGDMTLDDFKQMIAIRVPNPSKEDQIEIDKLLQDKSPETGWCNIL